MNTSELARIQTLRTINREDIGFNIYYQNPKEAGVVRDADRDIAGVVPGFVKIPCHPVIMNPGQKIIERAGMKGPVSCILNIAGDDYTTLISKKPPDISRHRIFFYDQGGVLFQRFEVDQWNYKGTIATGFRYVILGLVQIT